MAIVTLTESSSTEWLEAFEDKGPEPEEDDRDFSPRAKRQRATKIFRTKIKGEAFHYPCGPGRKTKRVKNQSVTTQNRL